jgi:hypothetical protein
VAVRRRRPGPVSAYRAREGGTYDVGFLVGLDGATIDPIVRYVTMHAAESERLRPGGVGSQGRQVSSVSAKGQSVPYESAPIPGQADALRNSPAGSAPCFSPSTGPPDVAVLL